MLQNDLTILSEWYNNHNLALNIDKCKYITFSLYQSLIPTYSINSVYIQKLTSVNDLDINFDSYFTFNSNLSKITNIAYKSLGFLIRNCKGFTNPTTLKFLYCSTMRSTAALFGFLTIMVKY